MLRSSHVLCGYARRSQDREIRRWNARNDLRKCSISPKSHSSHKSIDSPSADARSANLADSCFQPVGLPTLNSTIDFTKSDLYPVFKSLFQLKERRLWSWRLSKPRRGHPSNTGSSANVCCSHQKQSVLAHICANTMEHRSTPSGDFWPLGALCYRVCAKVAWRYPPLNWRLQASGIRQTHARAGRPMQGPLWCRQHVLRRRVALRLRPKFRLSPCCATLLVLQIRQINFSRWTF